MVSLMQNAECGMGLTPRFIRKVAPDGVEKPAYAGKYSNEAQVCQLALEIKELRSKIYMVLRTKISF
jgi:hypothetical protein